MQAKQGSSYSPASLKYGFKRLIPSLTADEYSPEAFQIEPNEEMFELSSQSTHPFDQEMDAIFPDLKSDKKGMSKQIQENKVKNEIDFAKIHTKTITLVEALLVRNEFAKAQSIIDSFILKWGTSKELNELKSFLEKQSSHSEESEAVEILHPSLPLEAQKRHKKFKHSKSCWKK